MIHRASALSPAPVLSVALLALGALLATGCSESSLSTFPDDDTRADDDDTGLDDDDDDGTPDDDDSGGPFDDGNDDDDTVGDDDDASDDDDVIGDDDDDTPPPDVLDECPEGALLATAFVADDGSDQLVILSQGPTEASGTLTAPEAGLYAVYDTAIYESGNSQQNESSFVRITNSTNPGGEPTTPNCGLDYIIVDGDNGGSPPGALIYLGTFELVAGDNDITLYHYCALYRQGFCESFHIGDPDSGAGCNTNNANSVHLTAGGICLVPE